MAKPFKIFLWIVGSIVGLIVIAAITLPLVLNPNSHKGQITGAVKDATGRELKITGDIKLRFFPWLGASVSNVELENAQGFGPEPFAHINDMTVGVRVMPLIFKHTVEVATIHVDGLALNLAKNKDGKTNWADLSGNEKEKPAQQPEGPGEGGGVEITGVTIGGLDVKNVSLSYDDKQSGSAYKVANLSVQTGAIELNKPLDVEIGFIVSSTKPALESDVKLKFTANANLDTKIYEINDLKLASTTKGATVPGGSQKATMQGSAVYDMNKGTFAFSNGELEAAGLKISAALAGEGLSTETPKLSGKISSNTFNPKEIAKSFGVALPPTSDASALTQMSFATDVAGTTKNAKLENLTLKLDKTTATGHLEVDDFAKQSIAFALKADAFNADAYTAPAGAGDKDKKEEDKSKSGDFKSTEIPIEALDSVNAHGTIELGALTVKGLKMTAIKIVIDALKGQPKTENMTGLLYGGKITQSVVFTHHSPAHYDMKVGLDAINSAPLLKDLVGKSFLSGLGNFQLNASSGGMTVGDVLKGLSGTVGTSFQNGALEGFNLEQTIAGAKAALSGQAAPSTNEPKRTEFKNLSAAGKIVNGILNTDTLDVKGNGFALGGNGAINLVDQTFDYTLLPALSGDKYKDLAGQKIPIKVSGAWTNPSIKVDLAGAVRGQVQQKVEQQKEKAKERFGDFLRKKLAPPPEQQPQQQPQAAPAQQPQSTAPTPAATTQPAPSTTEQKPAQ